MRVLVSGGGTAGHIYPALTVAERLVAEGRGVWIDDPDVDGVCGLVFTEDRRRAWLVVYVTARDFETGVEFEEEAMR